MPRPTGCSNASNAPATKLSESETTVHAAGVRNNLATKLMSAHPEAAQRITVVLK